MDARPDSLAAGVELAGPGQRLASYLIDTALVVLTLGIGWLIWFLVVSGNGQSPAKQLLGLRVIRDDGYPAGTGWMFTRDIVLQFVVFVVLDRALSNIVGDGGSWVAALAFAVSALWCVWDRDRQCLWDKVARTRVIRAARGVDTPAADRLSMKTMERLRTLEDMHERGLLTDEDYERRAREVERL